MSLRTLGGPRAPQILLKLSLNYVPPYDPAVDEKKGRLDLFKSKASPSAAKTCVSTLYLIRILIYLNKKNCDLIIDNDGMQKIILINK